jgi:hypothetical protein
MMIMMRFARSQRGSKGAFHDGGDFRGKEHGKPVAVVMGAT